MAITLQEHIQDLQTQVDLIDSEQEAAKVMLEQLNKELAKFQVKEERKRHLQAAISNLTILLESEPEVQAVLNPVDPFGDAADWSN